MNEISIPTIASNQIFHLAIQKIKISNLLILLFLYKIILSQFSQVFRMALPRASTFDKFILRSKGGVNKFTILLPLFEW